jgi:hypothetical protein
VRLRTNPRVPFSKRSGSNGGKLARELPLDHVPLGLPAYRLLEAVHSVTTIERTACQAKIRLRKSPSKRWLRSSSIPSPKRRSDSAASSSRVINADDRVSAVVLWRSQDSPARTPSVTNPTASALPTGPGFTGRAWPITVGLFPRCATRSPPAPKEAPHEPQKRFSGGLACRHRWAGRYLFLPLGAASLPITEGRRPVRETS